MPIYEFLCNTCNRSVSLFIRTASARSDLKCPLCGKTDLKRIISSFAIHKSIGTVHEESGIPGQVFSQDYYKDPRNIGRNLEKHLQEMNVEMPSEIQKSIDAARDGVLPESLKDLNSASSDSTYH